MAETLEKPPLQEETQEKPQERLPEKQAFALLKGHLHGTLTPQEQREFEARVISAGSIQAVLPESLVQPYLLARTRTVDQLVSYFDAALKIKKISFDRLFAWRLVDPSENFFRRFYSLLHRHVTLHSGGNVLTRGSKQKDLMKNLAYGTQLELDKLEEASGTSLRELFDREYTGKPYQFSDTQDDKEALIRAGKEDLNFATVEELLPNANADTLGYLIAFLARSYLNKMIPERCEKLLQQCFSTISSLRHLEVLGNVIPALLESEPGFASLLPDLKKTFYKSREVFISNPRNFWSALDLDDSLVPKAVKENPALFAQGFFQEPDLLFALHRFSTAPAVCQRKVVENLFGEEELLKDANLKRKAAVVFRCSQEAVSRLPAYILRHAKGQTAEGREQLAAQAEMILQECGKQEDAKVLRTAIEQVQEKEKAAREAAIREKERRVQEHVEQAARKALEKEQGNGRPKGPITAEDFCARLGKKLPRAGFPSDFQARAASLKPVQEKIQEDLFEILSEPDFYKDAWGKESTREISCEEGSVLYRLGVSAVRFKKTTSFDVEFVFEVAKEGEEPPFVAAAHINDFAEVTVKNLPPELGWLGEIFTTEVHRLFYKLLIGSEEKGYDLATVRVLLGLEEYQEEVERVVAKTEARAVTEPKSAEPQRTEEELRRERTASFLKENFGTFQKFLAWLRGNREIHLPALFSDVSSAFFQTQALLKVNKGISPGGVQVQLGPQDHILAGVVPSIKFCSPAQSRETFRQLGVTAEMFHIEDEHFDEHGELDAYLAIANVEYGGETHALHFCILPPHFDVYPIGVDFKNIFDDKDAASLAFLHMVLEAFRTAVMRQDDSSNTTPALAGNLRAPWARRIQEVVTHITQAQYPLIVVEWKPLGKAKNKDVTAEDAAEEGSAAHTPYKAGSRSADVESVFEKLYTDPGEVENKLVSRGVFLRAEDYVRFIPGGDVLFPEDAWEKQGAARTLKQGYREIFVPVQSPEQLHRLLAILRERKAVRHRTEADASAWFRSKLLEHKKSGAAIFDEAIRNGLIQVSAEFTTKMNLFRSSERHPANPYALLFEKVWHKCRAADPEIMPQDVFDALLDMPELNPERVFLAVSSPANYRMPYLFREGGAEMPPEKIFQSSDFELPPETSSEVVAIIAGNRARFSGISEAWLRGSNRTEAQDFAAQIQNPYRSKKAGREISLLPLTRAVLVWQFNDRTHSFTYLDAAREHVNRQTLARTSAEERLFLFPGVRDAIESALQENGSKVFTDFSDASRWNYNELLRLQDQGVLQLGRDADGKICITWSKPIVRKKIAVFTEEQVGYRQFQTDPVSLQDYQQFGHTNDLDLGLGLPYDPKTALIQREVRRILA